jgi:alkanesulfonate monooxygenase SsuD/methylene tetrahydromethanopterin reductase-like flavin-dependent oxidoreductase (luciferase family)
MLHHSERYACSEEWIEIVKRLWTEDETFDFEGKYYKISKGYLQPKPVQDPYPAIMNAGSSDRGRHFAAKYCDVVYTIVRGGGTVDNYRAHVDAYRKLAREEYGRDIRVWSLVNIVQGETEKEARDFYNYYVHEKGDWEAARNVVDTFMLDVNARNIPPERVKALQEVMIATWGGYSLIGTKEQVVDGLQAMSRAGLDGVLLAFPRFEAGMREFRDVTYPLVKQAGLRD